MPDDLINRANKWDTFFARLEVSLCLPVVSENAFHRTRYKRGILARSKKSFALKNLSFLCNRIDTKW